MATKQPYFASSKKCKKSGFTNKIFFKPGKGKKGVLGNIDLPFRMLALKIDYKKSKRGYT
jgi:hypothetical protein